MIGRGLIGVVLLASSLFAQASAPLAISGAWVGPLEWNQPVVGYSIRPTRVTLTYTDGAITGRWVSAQGSGDIVGTLDRGGNFKLTITVFGNAQRYDDQLTPTTIEAERCHGVGTFEGIALPSGIIRLATKRIASDTPINEVRGRNCTNPTNVMWTLQRDDVLR